MKTYLMVLFLYLVAIQRPQPSDAGIIDPRFPDYIVDPPVVCDAPGDFPHPRNCSWFYRCHSVELPLIEMKIFRREYFQCSDGTVFHEKLRKCSWGDWKSCNGSSGTIDEPDCSSCFEVSLNDCDVYEVCPNAHNKSASILMKLCQTSSFACHGCNNLGPCKKEEWTQYWHEAPDLRKRDNKDGVPCYPSPHSESMKCSSAQTTPPPCTNCSLSTSRCQVREVCPNGSSKVSLTLCQDSRRICEPCGSEERVCDGGKFYSVEDGKCYTNPDAEQMQCSSATTTPLPCDICSISTSRCQVREVCPNGSSMVSLTLCQDSQSFCEPCGSEEEICQRGKFYSMEDGKCYSNPESDEMKCLASTTTETTISPCDDCTVSTGDCESYEVCPEGKEPIAMTLCSNASRICQPCGHEESACPDGEYYNREDEQCYSGPDSDIMKCPPPSTTVPPCDDCYVSTSRCHDYEVCPNGAAQVILTLCPVSERVCDPCGSTEKVCSHGEYYSMQDRVCYSNPESHSMKCQPSTPPPTIQPPCDDCYISTRRCQLYNVCPHGEHSRSMMMCPTANTLCEPCGSQEPVCKTGQYYSMDSGQCVAAPDSPSMKCHEKTSPAPGNKTSPTQAGFGLSTTPINREVEQLLCSHDNIIPQASWIKEKFCKNLPLCSKNGIQTSSSELCYGFYHCNFRVKDKTWEAVEGRCPPDMLFSYQEEKCIQIPRNLCKFV